MCLPIRSSTTRDALVKGMGGHTSGPPIPGISPYDRSRRLVLSRENAGNFVRTQKVPRIATGERGGREVSGAPVAFLLRGACGALAVS